MFFSHDLYLRVLRGDSAHGPHGVYVPGRGVYVPGAKGAPHPNGRAPPNLTKAQGSSKSHRWPRATSGRRMGSSEREVIMKKIIFIAVVAIAALAVILDDGRPRPRMYRHH